MIHCIRFVDVAAYLTSHGFVDLGEAGEAHVFENLNRPHGLPEYCTIHLPNHRGMVTEMSVDDAFHEARVPMPAPTFDTDWCD